MNRIRKKKSLSIIIKLTLAAVALFWMSIGVKSAVKIEIAEMQSNLDVNSLIGTSVTILCEYASNQESEPPPNGGYQIIAIQNDARVFEPISQYGIQDVYLSNNKKLVGNAIKKYNYGFKNQFILSGVLCYADPEDKTMYPGAYVIELETWDIVYPVHHWEFYLGPDNEFYRSHLFPFDYIIP